MEINEATCLCRFGGCEVLRDRASAESNYWSVTSGAECFHARSSALIYGMLTFLSVNWDTLQKKAHTWKCVFSQVVRFTWAPWVGKLWECEISSSPIRLSACHYTKNTQLSSSKTVGPPQCFCLWSGFLCHTYTDSFTHTYARCLCSMPRPHHSDPPHTHAGWCSEVSESSGW